MRWGFDMSHDMSHVRNTGATRHRFATRREEAGAIYRAQKRGGGDEGGLSRCELFIYFQRNTKARPCLAQQCTRPASRARSATIVMGDRGFDPLTDQTVQLLLWFNSFRTAVPFGGRRSCNESGVYPKGDCSPKRVQDTGRSS